MKRIVLFLILIIVCNNIYSQDFWEPIPLPIQGQIFSIETGINNVFIGSGNGIHYSSNWGETWDTLSSGWAAGAIKINELGSIYTFGNNEIRRKQSLTSNWETLYTTITSVNVIQSYNGGIMYSSEGQGSNYFITRSLNYGDSSTWEQVFEFNTTGEFVYDIEIIDPDTIYASTINFFGGGGVYGSFDGGENWGIVGLDSHFVSSLASNSHGDLFAGTRGHYSLGNGGVFILHKGQGEWEQLISNILVTSMEIDPEDHIYIGCSHEGCQGGVRRSNDNGQTWELINSGFGYPGIEHLTITQNGYLLAGNEYFAGLYKSVEPVINIVESTKENIDSYNLHPNPTNDIITIEILKTHHISGRIIVYDFYGARIIKIKLNKANHKYVVDLKSMPSGIYLCKLLTKNKNKTWKIIKN